MYLKIIYSTLRFVVTGTIYRIGLCICFSEDVGKSTVKGDASKVLMGLTFEATSNKFKTFSNSKN